MLRRVLIAVATLLPVAAQAQTVRGTVKEAGTETPISGATIELVGADSIVSATATSDSAGYFQMRPRAGGRLVVRPSHPSYAAVRSDTVTVESGEVVTLVVNMGRSAIPLEPLVVTARMHNPLDGFNERMRRRAFGHFITLEQITDRRPLRASDLLQVVPGVHVMPVYSRSGFATQFVLMRGSIDRCPANIFLDGAPMKQYEGSGVDELIPVEILGGVEIYPSSVTAPAELQYPGNDCGIVAFWTNPERSGRPFSWKRLAIGAVLVGGVLLLTR